MKKIVLLLCVFVLAVGVACDPPEEADEETEETEEEEAEEEEGEEEEAAEAAGPVPLGDLGVQAALPEGAEAGDALVGDGVTVQGPGLVVGLSHPGDFTKTDGEEALADAEDMYDAEGAELEELEDGWILTFTNEGGMGTNYWVQSVRTIGDVEIVCETTADREDQQENAVEFCKSVEAAE